MSPPERQLWPEHPCNKKVAFDLEACNNQYPASVPDKPVHREPRPLMKAATREKERDGKVVCQVSEVAAAILAQLTEQVTQLRSGVITLASELGSLTFREVPRTS